MMEQAKAVAFGGTPLMLHLDGVVDAVVVLALLVVESLGVVEGAAGVVEIFGVVEGAAGVVEILGVVEGAAGVVEGAAGVVLSCRFFLTALVQGAVTVT